MVRCDLQWLEGMFPFGFFLFYYTKYLIELFGV